MITNLAAFSLINGGGASPGPPEPSPPDVPYSTWIKRAELPSGTIAIPDNSFNGFSNLHHVTINAGLTTIGNYAFYDCMSLKDIEIPDSVTEIGVQAIGYGANGKISDVTIYGDYETAAEEYANRNNVEFVYIRGAFAYETTTGGLSLESLDLVGRDVVVLTSHTPASGVSQKIKTPPSINGIPVAYIVQGMFNSETNISELKLSFPFSEFLWRRGAPLTVFPSSVTKVSLPSSLADVSGIAQLFASSSNLQEIELENGFNAQINCSACPLTQQSLVRMLTALADLTGLQAKTLTVGSANLAKLTNEQIAIATEKNWTLA